MMRFTRGGAALIAGLFGAMLTMKCFAASTMTFTPSGDANAGHLKGEACVDTVGSVKLRDGRAALNGRVLTIKAASDLSESPHVVLAGSILRSEVTAKSANSFNLTGMALLLMGELLGQIDDPQTPDVVFVNGRHIQGRIIGPENNHLAIRLADGTQTDVPFSEILFIRSPRVFVFTMAARTDLPVGKEEVFEAAVEKMVLKPTSAPRSISMMSIVPKNDGDGEFDSGFAGQTMHFPAPTGVPSFRTGVPADLFDESDEPAVPSFGGFGNTMRPDQSRMMLPPWFEN